MDTLPTDFKKILYLTEAVYKAWLKWYNQEKVPAALSNISPLTQFHTWVCVRVLLSQRRLHRQSQRNEEDVAPLEYLQYWIGVKSKWMTAIEEELDMEGMRAIVIKWAQKQQSELSNLKGKVATTLAKLHQEMSSLQRDVVVEKSCQSRTRDGSWIFRLFPLLLLPVLHVCASLKLLGLDLCWCHRSNDSLLVCSSLTPLCFESRRGQVLHVGCSPICLSLANLSRSTALCKGNIAWCRLVIRSATHSLILLFWL
jgi:hypothetical protein